MKRILITGANSYIGVSFKTFLNENFSGEYAVDSVSLRDGTWRDMSFAGYDTVFHTAGIVHIRETEKNAHLYYEINRDMTLELAEKAKADGVSQFVFLSSMSVYGLDTGIITRDTVPRPESNYGISKLQAEEGLNKLEDDTFRIAILRPPTVYGEGCKGNYNAIKRLVKIFPFFPRVNNRRSMLHIDRLSGFVRTLIDKNSHGLFFPQDEEYMNTSALAKKIAAGMGKKIYCSRSLGFCVKCLMPFSRTARKAFGDLIYQLTGEPEV